MELVDDDPDLAVPTLTRAAAEESEAPGGLDGHMHNYLDNMEQRTDLPEAGGLAFGRVHFKDLDDLPGSTGADAAALLDTAEVEALEVLWVLTCLGCSG